MAARWSLGWAAGALVGGTVLLAGCAADSGEGVAAGASPAATPSGGADAGSTTESSAETTQETAPTTEPETPDGPNAFAFAGPLVDGSGTFDGLTLDDRDVILWFWAPWCPTCLAEAPEILEAIPQLPEGVEVVGLAGLSGDLEYMQEFVEISKTGDMTHVADLDGEIWRGFDVVSQATLMVIDDSGEAYELGGGTTAEDLIEYAQKIASS